MKRLSLLSLISLSLLACQVQPVLPPAGPGPVRAPLTAFNQTNTGLLPLSPALRAELQQPDTEPEPRQEAFNEELVRQILGVQYIQSHSYYFQTQDQGKSSVEAILAHDGYARAAALTRHWQAELGPNSTWPDRESTTYNGPWPALEHAELANGKGWFGLRSASTKAEEYYQRALDAWQPGLPPEHPQQAESWAWLARSSHFLQDITVPFHTMSLVRPAQLIHHNSYEKSCDELFDRYLPSRNHNPHGVWQQGPYPAQGKWGIYFAPGTRAKEIVTLTANEVRPFYKLVNRRDNPSQDNWEKTRAVMLPLGAKTTAGLIVQFLRELGLEA